MPAIHLRAMVISALALSACASPVPPPEMKPAQVAMTGAVSTPETVEAQSRKPQASSIASASEPDGRPTDSADPIRKGKGDTIHFLSDSTEVDEQGMKLLLANANRLKGDPHLVVTLVAHTESSGSRSYNLAIAEEEIDAVRALLRSFGVPARQIRHRSAGRRKASANCATQSCRQEMRHVNLLYE